jgi:hypothetical protein
MLKIKIVLTSIVLGLAGIGGYLLYKIGYPKLKLWVKKKTAQLNTMTEIPTNFLTSTTSKIKDTFTEAAKIKPIYADQPKLFDLSKLKIKSSYPKPISIKNGKTYLKTANKETKRIKKHVDKEAKKLRKVIGL